MKQQTMTKLVAMINSAKQNQACAAAKNGKSTRSAENATYKPRGLNTLQTAETNPHY